MIKKTVIFSLLFCLLVQSCRMPSTGNNDPFAKHGSFAIRLKYGYNSNRNILPDESNVINHYNLLFTDPFGQSLVVNNFTDTIYESIQVTTGDWTLVANAYNKNGFLLKTGSVDFTVFDGDKSIVEVVVREIPGNGTFDLSIEFEEQYWTSPFLYGYLKNAVNDSIDLPFDNTPAALENGVSGITMPLANGFYTLVVKMSDSGAADSSEKTYVDVVQILSNATTTGSITFSGSPDVGVFQVNILPEINDPVDVTLTLSNSLLEIDEVVNFEASVPAGIEPGIIVWYEDGSVVKTDSNVSTSSYSTSWSMIGSYTVAATFFSADGKRAGSANTSVDVGALSEKPVIQGNWSYVGVKGFSSNVTMVDMEVGAGDVPFVAHSSGGTGRVLYYDSSTDSWIKYGGDITTTYELELSFSKDRVNPMISSVFHYQANQYNSFTNPLFHIGIDGTWSRVNVVNTPVRANYNGVRMAAIDINFVHYTLNGGVYRKNSSTNESLGPLNCNQLVFDSGGHPMGLNQTGLYIWDFTQWVHQGSSANYGSYKLWSSAFDHNTNPFVAFVHNDSDDKPSAERFINGAWENIGDLNFGDKAVNFVAIAVSRSNVPYILVKDLSSGERLSLYGYIDGLWVLLSDGFTDRGVRHIDFVAGLNKNLYVAYRDYNTAMLVVMEYKET